MRRSKPATGHVQPSVLHTGSDAKYLMSFANGAVCIRQGHKFFMIALKDVDAAEHFVREIRGLLPAGAPA